VQNVSTEPMIEMWLYFDVLTLQSTVDTAVDAMYCNI